MSARTLDRPVDCSSAAIILSPSISSPALSNAGSRCGSSIGPARLEQLRQHEQLIPFEPGPFDDARGGAPDRCGLGRFEAGPQEIELDRVDAR